MDPTRALRQIAFELERAGAPTYRVQAFRRAAAVLAGLPAEYQPSPRTAMRAAPRGDCDSHSDWHEVGRM